MSEPTDTKDPAPAPTEFKTIPVRFERSMHRALVLYATDHELTLTAVIRQAVATKLAIPLESQTTVIEDLENGKGKKQGTRKTSSRSKSKGT